MFEAGAVVGHHQLQFTVAVDIVAHHRQCSDTGNRELCGGILEDSRADLPVHVQRARFAGIVMVHPGRRHDEIEQAVAGQVGGGDVVGPGGGEYGTLAGQAAGTAPVDVGVQFRGDPVLGVDHDEVEESVAVHVGGMAHPSAVVGQLPPAPLAAAGRRLGMDPGRAALVVAVGVGEYQVDVAIAVGVGAMDPLHGTGSGRIQVVAAVVELAAPEYVESAVLPALFGAVYGFHGITPVTLAPRRVPAARLREFAGVRFVPGGWGMTAEEPERGFEPLTCSLRVNRSAN